VTVDVRGPHGRYELAAKFLVGADGGHSIVRKYCGIDFPGITDRGFVGRSGQVTIHPPVAVPGTGELLVPGAGRFRPATFTRTENGMFAYGMFQPGLYRVAVYEWASSPLEDSTSMPLEELRAAVRRVIGGDVPMSEPAGGEPSALRRSTGANSRQADRYRHGRVFLAGDAAHVHSGVGGPGLNLGMQDVLNLGWKLAAGVNGWAPEGLLDTYQSERHPVGQRVIMHTRAQTSLLSPGANITALRELFEELLREQSTVRHHRLDGRGRYPLRHAHRRADACHGRAVDAGHHIARWEWPKQDRRTASSRSAYPPHPCEPPRPDRRSPGLERPGRCDHRSRRRASRGCRADPPGRLRCLGGRHRHPRASREVAAYLADLVRWSRLTSHH
jgi:2-polyprenyl-6-methoxyphenol hydroxylase-like FAD-dependent oxidoreductase